MKIQTKQILQAAYDQCNEEERSLEYTIQYMQDTANVSLECVLKFMEE